MIVKPCIRYFVFDFFNEAADWLHSIPSEWIWAFERTSMGSSVLAKVDTDAFQKKKKVDTDAPGKDKMQGHICMTPYSASKRTPLAIVTDSVLSVTPPIKYVQS
jgi:hypothetical protein